MLIAAASASASARINPGAIEPDDAEFDEEADVLGVKLIQGIEASSGPNMSRWPVSSCKW